MQADIFGTDIVTISSSEGPALGVALLAGVEQVFIKVCWKLVMRLLRLEQYKMQIKTCTINNKYYNMYKRLYNSLKKDFYDLADIIE